MRYTLSVFLLFFSSLLHAQTPSSQLQKQAELRQTGINKLLIPQSKDVKRQSFETLKPLHEKVDAVCFPIHTLSLETLTKASIIADFKDLIVTAFKQKGISAQTVNESNFKLLDKQGEVPCLSAVNIQNISILTQNSMIEEGWVTSRVLTPEQNLKTGELIIVLSTGNLTKITVNQSHSEKTHANRATLINAFPLDSGEAINLRDLEQGLENLRRLPTVTAQMNILPSENQGSSDVQVDWQQASNPIRLTLSVDDSGSESTGKYLGTVGLAWDNPLHINDILSVNYTHNLSDGEKQIDPNGDSDKGDTYNYALNYSVPWGYWLLDMSASHYNYNQVVAGLNRNYHFLGDNDQANINLSRVLYRDDKSKLTATAGLWSKSSKNYIDDAEVLVQRRRTGGWKAELSHRQYFSKGTLSSSLNYKRGTRAFGGFPVPEELFDEGTAKVRIWTTDIDWQMPFQLSEQHFSWHSHLHGQYNQTQLTPQDKFSIGGRHTVRGFSGSKTLSADRGLYIKNDIAWQYIDNHQLYLGLDIGFVSGESSHTLPGKSLSGVALGLKGQQNYHGNWNYDVFVGTPLTEPDNFSEDSFTTGINLNYSF